MTSLASGREVLLMHVSVAYAEDKEMDRVGAVRRSPAQVLVLIAGLAG